MQELFAYDDLTDYSHLINPFTFVDVKNVGWLNLKSNFQKGELRSSVLRKLKDVARQDEIFQPTVEPGRGFPFCEVCGSVKICNSGGELIRDAELWIPYEDIIFASPVLILHYIEVHHYLPPAEYIDAIIGIDIRQPFDAEKAYRDRLASSGWFHRLR